VAVGKNKYPFHWVSLLIMGNRVCLSPSGVPETPPSGDSEPVSVGKPDPSKSNLQDALANVESLVSSQDGKILLLQKLMDALEADIEKRRKEVNEGGKKIQESRLKVICATLDWHKACQVKELQAHDLLDEQVKKTLIEHVETMWKALREELLVPAPPAQPSMSQPTTKK
jgi:hypothetical protein